MSPLEKLQKIQTNAPKLGAPTREWEKAMKRKSLAMGMILPMAAAGAVASAPAASASGDKWDSSVSCELRAWRDDGDIKVKLEVESKGDQGRAFKVRIHQNGDRILRRTVWDRDGDFTVYKKTDDERGPDFFRATVRNQRTGDSDTCWVRVGRHRGHH